MREVQGKSQVILDRPRSSYLRQVQVKFQVSQIMYRSSLKSLYRSSTHILCTSREVEVKSQVKPLTDTSKSSFKSVKTNASNFLHSSQVQVKHQVI